MTVVSSLHQFQNLLYQLQTQLPQILPIIKSWFYRLNLTFVPFFKLVVRLLLRTEITGRFSHSWWSKLKNWYLFSIWIIFGSLGFLGNFDEFFLYSSVPNRKLFQISIQNGNCLRNSLAFRPDFFSESISGEKVRKKINVQSLLFGTVEYVRWCLDK